MENIARKSATLLPGLIFSTVLLTATVGVNKAEATPVNQTINATQLAWWHNGWHDGWRWNRGWGYHNRCSCWINRWGNRRCNCR